MKKHLMLLQMKMEKQKPQQKPLKNVNIQQE